MKGPRTITIVCHGANYFDVFEGESYTDHLCWDEMLGQIAQLTHPKIGEPRYEMLTPEGHSERESMRRRAVAESNAALAEQAGDTEAAINERAASWRQEQGE